MKNLGKIKRVFILGKPFKIIFRRKETRELVKDRERSKFLLGTCSIQDQRMIVADHLPVEETFDTILHETFHTLEAYLLYDSEETYVARMSTALTAFLLNNFKITLKKETL